MLHTVKREAQEIDNLTVIGKEGKKKGWELMGQIPR